MTTTAQRKLREIPVRTEVNPEFTQTRPRWLLQLENLSYKHRNKLVFIHVSMFLFFLALIVIPLFLPEPTEQASTFNNFTLFAQFLFWGIWFPLVFASVIFTGRSWCGVLCPMGAASEWTNKIGFKLKIPAWLRWEGTPILSFLLLTILGQTVDVRDEASAIAQVFGGTLVLALLIGLFFGKKKRAWCRHACPIGLLLGVFSRIGAVQFAPKLRRPGSKDAYAEKGICPTMVSIPQKQESRHCIQCFRCVKPSSPGGLFVRLRKPGDEIIRIREHNPNAAEVWFIFIATGIALGGFLWLILPSYQTLRQSIGEWFINHGWYWIGNTGPSWLMSVHPEQRQAYNWLDFITITSFMLGCMLLITLLLAVCTAMSSWLAGRFGADRDFKQRFIELGYQFAPVAMISIIISLGDKLFSSLLDFGMNSILLSTIKGLLLLGSVIWSICLGRKLLQQQSLVGKHNWFALLPGIAGSIGVALTWWPAIFGISYSVLEHYRHISP